MPKNYFVYILLCSDGSYYTGVTSEIEKRLAEHQAGLVESYTSKRLPVILVYSATFHDINQAIKIEKQIKGWSRKKKEALINGEYDLLKKLAECRNETHYLNKEKQH